MRLRALFLILLLAVLVGGQTPPPSNAKKEYLEHRAALLRKMAEIKAKLSALELELQILEESRPSDQPAPPANSWREEPAAAEGGSGSAKKSAPRCLSVTRDGKRCTRAAEPGAKYCWQHRNH